MRPIDTIRKEFLAALKDTRYKTEELRHTLESAAAASPELLQPHESEDAATTLDTTKTNWSPDHFSRHLFLAERNFSRERVSHLMEVRHFLRQRGDKGFAPTAKPAPQQAPAPTGSGAYQPPEILKKFVTDGDLASTRTALRLELNDNRLGSPELHEALQWAKRQLPSLYETYAEKAFARGLETNQSNWTPDYYDEQLVFLKANFAEKRFLHLIEVRAVLRAQGEKGFAPIAPSGTNGSRHAPPCAPRATAKARIDTSDPELNPALKTVLLLGGALAVVVILLFSLIK